MQTETVRLHRHPVVTTMIGGGLEMRSLAGAGGRKFAPIHGADGADALQGSVWGSGSGVWSSEFEDSDF